MKNIVETFDPEAFYSVEEVKFASSNDNSSLPLATASGAFDRLLRLRKGI